MTEILWQDKGQQYVEKRWIRNRVFSEIDGEISDFLPALVKEKLIQLRDPKPVPNPKPRGYNESKMRNYHQITGHDTKSCYVLKHVIQDLLDDGKIVIKRASKQPNIQQNPLPAHPRGVKESTTLKSKTPKYVRHSQKNFQSKQRKMLESLPRTTNKQQKSH
ncbi:hypothetical protein MKW92_051119 [Papaver armeniacum]|nr:hypothetical protein MKW92_051119 [Papaver armeniacum]